MAFNPSTPLAENITLLSSLKTRTHLSPATNEVNVEITRMYDMKLERCSLASTLALGSKLFNLPTFGDFADDLATGCFHLIQEFGVSNQSNSIWIPVKMSDVIWTLS